ncbi:peptidylprolyl isomerase [Selenihalanaerobacter shriftii]|uniref:Foldase protein PrsA n=1 Tax=Selenihalanaerobacter shriftii TaxID=142842 RepID=A0A1T4JLY4_9FIRM|nr:peptidylprolyl isomerase [Selenihalanaerobacter shriftii]SJZ31141.1 foldase protein PrsA [Selenihalanaerobacter shriftii]
MLIRKNKKLMVTLLVLGLLAIAVVGCNSSSKSNSQAIDESQAVAKVNDKLISKARFNKNVEQVKAQYQQQYGVDFSNAKVAAMLTRLKEQVLEQMIREEVLIQQAVKEGIEVTDKEIQAEFDKVKKKYKSADEFKKRLKEAGVTIDDIKLNIKNKLLLDKFSNKMTEDIEVTQKDLKDYFNKNKDKFVQPAQIKASHILVKTKEKAEKVKSELEAGANFAKLAKKYSTGPSGKNGGSLGYFGKGQMVPAFEKAAFNLEVGKISNPVKTKFGYHIIKVTDQKKSKKMKFAEIKGQIKSYLVKQKKQGKLKTYLDKAYKKSEIKKLVDFKAPKSEAKKSDKAKTESNKSTE